MERKLEVVDDDEPLADADAGALAAERAELAARWRSLTPRERQVFLHIVSGALNKEVAFHFGISEKTIKIHRAHVMEKMRAHSFADLVRMDERLRPGRPLTAM